MKNETFGHDWLSMDLPFPCETYWCFPRPLTIPGAKRVLVMCSEPLCSLPRIDWVIEHHQEFDLIFAYDRRLAHLPNVIIIQFGGSFCNEPPVMKDFTVSHLLSTGGAHIEPRFDGHKMRRQVARTINRYRAPVRLFFSSKGMGLMVQEYKDILANGQQQQHAIEILRESKSPLFTSMFHICIENVRDDYFFTEKIMDCFRTYTVPIYWGTSTITEFFDKDGMLFFDKAEDVNDILSSLTIDDYWKRLPHIQNNFKLAEQYLDPVGRMKNHMLKCFAVV